jgi:hypothetical protein
MLMEQRQILEYGEKKIIMKAKWQENSKGPKVKKMILMLKVLTLMDGKNLELDDQT